MREKVPKAWIASSFLHCDPSRWQDGGSQIDVTGGLCERGHETLDADPFSREGH